METEFKKAKGFVPIWKVGCLSTSWVALAILFKQPEPPCLALCQTAWNIIQINVGRIFLYYFISNQSYSRTCVNAFSLWQRAITYVYFTLLQFSRHHLEISIAPEWCQNTAVQQNSLAKLHAAGISILLKNSLNMFLNNSNVFHYSDVQIAHGRDRPHTETSDVPHFSCALRTER